MLEACTAARRLLFLPIRCAMDITRLKQFVLSRHACVRVVTHEEADVVELALGVAHELSLQVLAWSVTDGVRAISATEEPPVPNTSNPAQGLRWLRQSVRKPTMIVLRDVSEQLRDSVNLRAFRDLVESVRNGSVGVGYPSGNAGAGVLSRSVVLMVDHSADVPAVVSAESALYEVRAPNDEDIRVLVKAAVRNVASDGRGRIGIKIAGGEEQFLDALVQNLRGLTRRQVRQLVTEIVATDRTLSDDDIAQVQRGKRALLRGAGVLEFVEAPTSMDRIGGLNRLKKWLAHRELSFSEGARDFGLMPPRGVLLLGVQGAGKSLAAKAIATAWKRPLMRLDPGALFDKYIGETERKLRDALAQAEAMSPVVLWIDEIEKGFASAAAESTDGGVGRRMFGTLLTWMQEHRAPVFLVATANDIAALPPELLRKGRFDEIFFVDLPDRAARETIWRIHLTARKREPSAFDLGALADASEGYSGAEIEQAVLSAMHECFATRAEPTTERLMAAARSSPPLSATKREALASLRHWAQGRCVQAD
ncbi:MAG: AAA family ATPase [Phycisphaerales bacterium]